MKNIYIGNKKTFNGNMEIIVKSEGSFGIWGCLFDFG